ncbi:hypothetical protein ACIOC2_09110 [Streptomyces sp. NPDC088337]|uniref:hypothetical protein n=1 Tax=unclassified Streptomyces TaxID=2593676 RepID=UPI002DDB7CAC|nr:hypothetical protein [Streptomyces sp. NBC_01788]WSB28566.1 hypothetical protein OIE49_23235 [Streptomyces sp. NBC_01788]
MSRETDTPSSGPNGRGGAAYPSGTPPYGIPAVSDDRADAGRSAAQPEERKTETTLTTRIRINIPGSRPIPPVVVRTPVSSEGSESDAEDIGGEAEQPAAPAPEVAPEPPAEPAAPAAEKPTSDWFAPRKPQAGKGGQGGGSTNGAGLPGGSGARAAIGPGPGASGPGSSVPRPVGAGSSGPGSSGGGRPGGVTGAMNLPGAAGGSRPGSPGAGLPGVTGGPVAPGHGGGTGSFDVTEALGAGPHSQPRREDLAYFSDNGQGVPGAPGGPQGPKGPTSGPVTGDASLRPPAGGGPGGAGRPGGVPGARTGHPGGPLSDDTAVLTPQQQSPQPGTPGYGARPDNVSGNTVTSGMPVIQPGPDPFGPEADWSGPQTQTPPGLSQPAPQSAAAATAPKAKKKGRNKLVLLGVAVIGLAGVAYGAGLLMNHSDVPKGTTVLGVDIGGGTRDDAVKKLDDAFGSHVNQPLKLSVEGKSVTLKPDQAGLQFDTQATASAAATSDYNPVSVIGSLFGNHRVIQPQMPVDEEKLQVALQSVSGGAGSMTEGGIKFQSGKAVPVYGKPGKGIDVGGSIQLVQQAYRVQVETGSATPVQLPTVTQQPTVPNAEVDRMMKEFAEPAMSGNVIARTDATHFIEFSPQNSLWKFLRVKAVDGKLVDSYDEAALKELYGNTFDGVTIARATGDKTPVTVQDVIGALRPALMSKTNRVGVIDTDPS